MYKSEKISVYNNYDLVLLIIFVSPIILFIFTYCLVGFRSQVEVESTYWALVKLLSLQRTHVRQPQPSNLRQRLDTSDQILTLWTFVDRFITMLDVPESDISKMLPSSTSNLVSFMLIKSRHFTLAYHFLLHKSSHTSCVLFFFWFLRAGSGKSTPSVSLK